MIQSCSAPRPQSNYIASDADYVDYITELMGGFAIPPFIKPMRQGKRYLFLGMRFNRDSERMVMADIIHGSAQPPLTTGWAFIETPTDKEKRYLKKMGIAIVDADCMEMLAAAQPA